MSSGFGFGGCRLHETERARRFATVAEVEVVRCITSRSDQTGKYFSYNFGVVFSLLSFFSRLLFSSLLVFSLPFSSSPFVFSSLFFSSRLVSHLVFSSPFFSSRLVSPRLVLGSRRFESLFFSSRLVSHLVFSQIGPRSPKLQC